MTVMRLAFGAGLAAIAAVSGMSRPHAAQVMAVSGPASAPASANAPAPANASYADIVDLADKTPIILRAEIRKIARLDPARSVGVKPGQARVYVEARTQALLFGASAIGESLRYLVDVPLDARGKLPNLRKSVVLLFARPVANLPGELQLVAPDAQIAWAPDTEARVRGVIAELLAPGAPGRVTAVREAIHVPGTLAGTGETQFFLQTPDGSAASITVLHRADGPPSWSASFTEVLESASPPPQRDTLAWYRLACFLPDRLPGSVNVSETAAARALADGDWRQVKAQLGACGRTRG